MLPQFADTIVGYNRDIVMKCDDSVIAPSGGEEVIIRRARGIAPKPFLFNYKLSDINYLMNS